MVKAKVTKPVVEETPVTPASIADPTSMPIEGEIVNGTRELANVPVPTSMTTLIPLGSLLFQEPGLVIQAVTVVAKELVKIVDDLKLFKIIKNKKFVFVDGWETLGGMLGVSAHEESSKRWEDGSWESVVLLKRNSDGQVVGRASALCGMDEEWASRDEYARKSMATTRATGKAYRLSYSWIMKLAGYEGTPAEEMTDEEQDKEAAKETTKQEPRAPQTQSAGAVNKRPFDRPLRPKPDDAKSVFAGYAMKLGIPKADIKTEITAMLKDADLSFNVSLWEKLCLALENWCAGKPATMPQVEPEVEKQAEPATEKQPELVQQASPEAEKIAEDPTDGAPAQAQPEQPAQSEETK